MVALALLAAAAAAVGARAATERIGAATIAPFGTLPTVVPGPRLHLPWPARGQADLVATSGIDFGSSGPTTPVPIASVTKMMTAYLVLHDHPLQVGQGGPVLTITAAEAAELPAREQDQQTLVIVKAGEQLTEEQALEALLLPSADNIADILARFDAGTITAFVAKMNATASFLGMTHTHYADPSGLDPASESTAADQLLLARVAMQVPALAAIVAKPAVTLPVAGTVSNTNTLVGHDGYVGIKTGSTNAAGGCLVWKVTRTVGTVPVTLYGVVLGQSGGPYVAAAIRAAKALTDGAFAAMTPHEVLAAGTPLFAVRRAGRRVFAVTKSSLTTIDPPGTPVHLSVSSPRRRDLRPGTGPVATVTLRTPDTTASTSVQVASRLPGPSLAWRLGHLA